MTNKMTVEEFINKKHELEIEVNKLIVAFSYETGIEVLHFTITREVRRDFDLPNPITVDSWVKVTLDTENL